MNQRQRPSLKVALASLNQLRSSFAANCPGLSSPNGPGFRNTVHLPSSAVWNRFPRRSTTPHDWTYRSGGDRRRTPGPRYLRRLRPGEPRAATRRRRGRAGPGDIERCSPAPTACPASAASRTGRHLLGRPALARVAIIATPDHLHAGPAVAAVERGYDVLLEKPIAPRAVDCLRVVEAADAAGRLLQIGHCLRYIAVLRQGPRDHGLRPSRPAHHPLDGRARGLLAHDPRLRARQVGQHQERRTDDPGQVLPRPRPDGLVRGTALPAPSPPSAPSRHFRPEDAPPGAPERCTDGCPVGGDLRPLRASLLPEGVPRLALVPMSPWPLTWRAADGPWRQAPTAAASTAAGNDVVDHQVLALEFEDGVTATFTMHGFAAVPSRTIRASGTLGELRGTFEKGEIEVHMHGEISPEVIKIPFTAVGHGGGDEGLLRHFVDVVAPRRRRRGAGLGPGGPGEPPDRLRGGAVSPRGAAGRDGGLPAEVAHRPRLGDREDAGQLGEEDQPMFIETRCDLCGDCLVRCLYVDYDQERAAFEIEELIAGRPAPILSACITCFACNEYCPTGRPPLRPDPGATGAVRLPGHPARDDRRRGGALCGDRRGAGAGEPGPCPVGLRLQLAPTPTSSRGACSRGFRW